MTGVRDKLSLQGLCQDKSVVVRPCQLI